MKRFILTLVLLSMLSSLGGCFIVDRDHWGWGHGGGRHHEERHEDRHMHGRY